jgi:hypothetical protein
LHNAPTNHAVNTKLFGSFFDSDAIGGSKGAAFIGIVSAEA